MGRFAESVLHPRSLRWAALVLLALFLAVWAWWPMIAAYPQTAIEDGRYFHHQIAIAKASVRIYHEVPLWNAFDCRGIPMWDHPENLTASPIFWLTLPLSTTATMIVWNIVHVVAGFVGMWLLARIELKLSRMAAMIAACFWAFGAGHTSQYAGEHEALISFLNAPLLLLLWRRAEHSWSAAVGCGLALAWMVFDGATYPLPFTVTVLGLETLLRVWPPRRGLRVAGAAAVVGLVAFTVAACRLLPLMDQFATHKRVMEDDFDQLANLDLLRDMFTLRTPNWRGRFHPNQQYVFGEYISFVGWLGLALALLGLLVSSVELWWLSVLAAMVLLLMLGHFKPWAPWTVLHAHVFPFKSMRVSARFRLLLLVPVSLWIALAAERVPRIVQRFSRSWAQAVQVVLITLTLLAAGDMIGLGQEILPIRFASPAEKRVTRSTRFYYGGPALADVIDQPSQNRAYTGCRAAWVYNADAAVWEGDLPQARSLSGDATVEVANRTHNTFTIDVDARQPSRLVLNSAYDRGWRSTIGTTAEQAHQLALDVPAGRHRILVEYWPKKLTLGLVLSGLGLLGSFLFLARRIVLRAVASLRRSRSRSRSG